MKRDPLRAAQWFERAVAGGLISAKVNLGVAFFWGLGLGEVSKNTFTGVANLRTTLAS